MLHFSEHDCTYQEIKSTARYGRKVDTSLKKMSCQKFKIFDSPRQACLQDLRAALDPYTKGLLSDVPVIPISVKDTVARSSAQIVDSNNYGMRVDPGTQLVITRTGDNSYTLTFTENGIQRNIENCQHTTNFVVCHDPLDDQGEPTRFRLDIQQGETVQLERSGLQILPTVRVGVYCDAACATKEPTGAQVITFCDGCGQELAARAAAQIVSTKMQAHLEESLASGQVTNLREVAAKMCDGMKAAQKEMKENGTTTFTQVAVVSGYAVVFANGDSKTFVKKADGSVVDITGGSRGNVNDASDPGGRVGFEGGREAHDYRGLSCYVYKLQPGEQIFVCSDGIHDNLDPETVGLTLQEAAKFCGGEWNLADGATWESSDPAVVGKLKQTYMEKKIAEVVGTSDDATAIQKLQEHVAEQTRGYKEATFRGENIKIKSHEEVHGKPDHATGVAMTYMGAAAPAKAGATLTFEPNTPYELKIATGGILKRVYGRAKAEFTETFVQVFKEVRPHPDNKEKIICIGLDGAEYAYDKSRIVEQTKVEKKTVDEMANKERRAMVDRQFAQQAAEKERKAQLDRNLAEQAAARARRAEEMAAAQSKPPPSPAVSPTRAAAEAKIKATKPLPTTPPRAPIAPASSAPPIARKAISEMTPSDMLKAVSDFRESLGIYALRDVEHIDLTNARKNIEAAGDQAVLKKFDADLKKVVEGVEEYNENPTINPTRIVNSIHHLCLTYERYSE